jgi:hypothetical protein
MPVRIVHMNALVCIGTGCILINHGDKEMSDYIEQPILDFTKSEEELKHYLTVQC